MAPAATDRGRRRREAVLDAAAELFVARGFHGASIDEVGAAAGISGPGVYRHVRSKDELLMAVLDRLWVHGFRPAVERAAQLPPREALAHLVAAHVELAVVRPEGLVLLIRELRHLPADYREASWRQIARYTEAWVAPMRVLRPGADSDELRAAAVAVHGLIDSAARFPDLAPAAVRGPLLRDLAAAALDRYLAA